MTQAVVERYSKPEPAVLEKLEQSRLGAEKLVRREIKCPNCGFYLLDVYGRDHHYTRVKCRKCKFNDVIDTALFRTIRTKHRKGLTAVRRLRPLR